MADKKQTKQWNDLTGKEKKRGLIALALIAFVVIVLISAVSSSSNDSKNAQTSETSAPSSSQQASEQPQKSNLEVIQEIGKVPDTYAFKPDSSEDANPEGPYKVVINSTEATECKYAKGQSYEAIKALFTNEQLKGSIDQVIYTSANYLVTSMGKEDGEQLTQNNGWTGVTNFYKTYFSDFEVQDRGQLSTQKTAVLSIKGCR